MARAKSQDTQAAEAPEEQVQDTQAAEAPEEQVQDTQAADAGSGELDEAAAVPSCDHLARLAGRDPQKGVRLLPDECAFIRGVIREEILSRSASGGDRAAPYLLEAAERIASLLCGTGDPIGVRITTADADWLHGFLGGVTADEEPAEE